MRVTPLARSPRSTVPSALLAIALAACKPTSSDRPPLVELVPAAGTYRAPLDVSVSCTDDQGPCEAIHYTLDGSAPGVTSPAYAGRLVLTASATVRAVGRDRAGQLSSLAAASYVVDGTPPLATAIPPGGSFASAPPVFLGCSDGDGTGCDQIRYTVDGSAPTRDSLLYGSPVLVADRTLLRFVAFDRVGNASEEGRAEYRVDTLAPASAASPPPGAFGAPLEVLLTCDDGAGVGCAGIRYTIDGAAPSAASLVYETPLHVATTTTVRYQGVDALGNEEAPREARYVVDLVPPVTVADPPAGASPAPLHVTLSCRDSETACAATRFTTDGSAPGPGSPLAAGPISIAVTTTLRFASVDAVGNAEPAREARYVVDREPPSARASPPGGPHGAGLFVTLTCEDGGGSGCAGVWYTLDGSTPTRASARYGGPISVPGSATLRFVAFDAAGNASPIGAERYAVDAAPPRLVASTPVAGAGGAAPSTPIRLAFDEPLVADALSATVNGAAAAVAYDPAARAVDITPTVALVPDAAYVVALEGVRDAIGNSAGPVSLSFRTRGVPLALDAAGSATAAGRGIAFDAAGNGVALSSTHTGKGRKLFLSRWDASTATWRDPVELAREDVATGPAPFPATVASNGTGFLVIWSTGTAVVARPLDAAGALGAPITLWRRAATALSASANRAPGWTVVASFGSALEAVRSLGLLFEGPEQIGSASGSVKLIPRKGECLAAYRRVARGQSSIVVASPVSTGGWQESVVHSTSNAVTDPDIAEHDTAGVGVAFTVLGQTVSVTFASVSGSGLLPPAQVVSQSGGATGPSIGATAAGFAVAWQASSADGLTVTQASYRRPGPDGTWSDPETIWSAAGAPALTRFAPSTAGWLAVAATGGSAPEAVLLERGSGGWSAPNPFAPPGAPVGRVATAATPDGVALSYDQDDGHRQQVRVVRRTGGVLGRAIDLLPPQPGSARELQVAGDGAGGALAVWSSEHRGGPAVFAARGGDGAFGPPMLVALGADQPVVAAFGSGHALVYRRAGTCEARLLGPGGLGPAQRLDVGAAGPCSSPRLASDGAHLLATWRVAWGILGAARLDAAGWSPPFWAASGQSAEFGFGAAGHAGRFAVAWGGTYDPLQTRLAAGPAAADWGAATHVGVWVEHGGVNQGPALAAGPAGFGAAWAFYNRFWATVSANGETWAAPVLLDAPTSSCTVPTMAALADGFAAAWDCGGARARVWRNGWSELVNLSATDTAAMRLASGTPGVALLLRESVGGALRGTTWRAGAWAPLETLRAPVSGEPALSWDGEAWLTGWIEADAADAAIDRVVVRRGL